MVIASLVGIGLHTYSLVHASSLRLTHDLLVATQTTVAGEVASYLEPVTAGSGIAHDMLQHSALRDKTDPFTLFAGALLRQTPQVQAFYLANSDGDFELIQRHGQGGLEQVIVTAQSGTRMRTTLDTDVDGRGDGPGSAGSERLRPAKKQLLHGSDPGQDNLVVRAAYLQADRAADRHRLGRICHRRRARSCAGGQHFARSAVGISLLAAYRQQRARGDRAP